MGAQDGIAIEPERTLPARSLEFWFDYTCPYAYLGSTQLDALAARMAVAVTYRPFLLGGVLRASSAPQDLAASRSPQRRAHDARDQQRWAARLGVPLATPASHPMRSVEALRATLAVGVDRRVVEGFFRAYWVDARPISKPEVIRSVVAAAGHDPDDVLERMGLPAIKDDLRARTDEAIARGVFGAPTFLVDGEHLYWGQDRIHFVEGVRKEARPRPAPARRRTLHVSWDFSSPFAYLGASQVDAIAARTGAVVVWHPILLGGLFRALGGVDVPLATFSEAKQRHVLADLRRWAAYWRVPFRFPSRFPAHSLKALRVYLALPEEHRDRYRDATFRACWAEDRDIADDAVLAACVGDEALAREAFARAGSDAVKAALRAETDQALARGVFGVPTFEVDGELFWGQDRLALVEDALAA